MVFAEEYPVIIIRITRVGPATKLAPTGEMSVGSPQVVQVWASAPGIPSQEHRYLGSETNTKPPKIHMLRPYTK